MKKIAPMLAAVFAAGLAVSLAWAAPPPGKGNGKDKKTSSASSSTTGSTSSTTTTATGKKIQVCHRTGSKKNPFVLISISRNALPAHLRHGDLMPTAGADGKPSCPKAPVTTTTTSTTATTTTSSP
jgi:hypothetical protein